MKLPAPDGSTGLARRPISEVGLPAAVKTLPDELSVLPEADEEADPCSSFFSSAFCCCCSNGVVDIKESSDEGNGSGLPASGTSGTSGFFFSSGDDSTSSTLFFSSTASAAGETATASAATPELDSPEELSTSTGSVGGGEPLLLVLLWCSSGDGSDGLSGRICSPKLDSGDRGLPPLRPIFGKPYESYSM